MLKQYKIHEPYILLGAGIVLSCCSYLFLGYFFERSSFENIFIGYVGAFVGYGLIYKLVLSSNQINLGFKIALLFRVLFLLAIPILSDDFYRFIWDGRMMVMGLNPYTFIPEYIINHNLFTGSGLSASLFTSLNSPQYNSVYPPLCQGVFFISSLASNGSILLNVLLLRLSILGAEVITLYYLPKILVAWGLKEKAALIYALNPLVIIELTGNLHFEALMICFLVLFFYNLQQDKTILAAIFFSLAIITKLIPFIFLPLVLFKLGKKKGFLFLSVLFLIISLAFFPFLAGASGFSTSIGLYFQKFEFNGSLYFLLREIGYFLAGFNLIYWIGKLLAALTFILILGYSWHFRNSKNNLAFHFLWIMALYLLFSTTVHPWYITPIILFSVFTSFRFSIIWSFMIFLTYIQYSAPHFKENLFVIFLEYGFVFIYLWYELSFKEVKKLQ